ncbi:MAG TPA: NAD(P)-dependent oxidoreductase [Candidatus Marinimicrobia bacterium]|nr:NAD(P)-dependent oxidoreductase [Candidatus Neomarinimicrobiota bacterium]
MEHIFLTGGTGFIGRHLTEALLESGFKVTLLSHHRTFQGKDHPNLHIIHGDIRYPSPWKHILRETDGVIHTAGSVRETNFYRYIRNNTEATMILARECSLHKNIRQFIFISSLSAAGPGELGKPIHEFHPAEPVCEYGKSKLMAEGRLFNLSAPFTKIVIRPPAVYGPYDKAFLPVFKLARHRIRPVFQKGLSEFSLIHVTDLCNIIVHLTLNPRLKQDEIFFVNDGVPIHTQEEMFDQLEKNIQGKMISIPVSKFLLGSFSYLAEIFGSVMGKTPLLTIDKYRELKQEAWTCYSNKLMDFLGYRIKYPLEKGLRDTYTWYRMHHWL